MSAKKLKKWTMLSAVSNVGLAYALYDITANGEVVALRDMTGDGWVDTVHVDTNGDKVADYLMQDTDGNGDIDIIGEPGENGEVADVLVEGGVFESLLEGLGSMLEFFG